MVFVIDRLRPMVFVIDRLILEKLSILHVVNEQIFISSAKSEFY